MSISRDLPQERLATSDQRGNRIYLYPAEITGTLNRLRKKVHFLLIFIFLALPWLRIHGRQAVLFDIAARRFTVFGISFWAHDAPMLVFVIGGAALTLGLITALWGRVWCGWACPQTVFIESFFRWIERSIEGDHLARKKLDQSEWDGEKVFKKIAKWSLFSLATLVIAHSFIAYFVGTEELSRMIRRHPAENPLSFGAMLFIAGAILFDFGWFREQFCTVLCPYGRFQSLLMDESSYTVAYDARRGEPRKGSEPLTGKKGDCVNCYRCVQVCPTGIDIRRGMQLECIGCTACIDACDDVMKRLGKPSGLIRYDSEISLRGGTARLFRGRTIAYLILIGGVIFGLALTLAARKPIETTFVRATDTPYQEINNAGGPAEITNRFRANVSNQSFENLTLTIAPTSEDEAKGVNVILAGGPVEIDAGKKHAMDFFVKFPKSLLSNGHTSTKISILSKSGLLITEELNLVGPYL